MVDLSNYGFKSLAYKTVKLEEYFVNSYFDEYFEYVNATSSTCSMCRILDAKYEKADLNEVITKQHQRHLTTTEYDRLLQVLKKFEDLFDGTLGTWNTNPAEFELKDDAKPVCS